MVERHVEEGAAGLRDDLLTVAQVCVDVDPPAPGVRHPGGQRKLVVDEDGAAIADEDSSGHRGKPVPRREETGGLVQRPGNEASVDDPGPGLMVVVERDDGLVALDPELGRLRKMEALRVVTAAPARRVVVGRNGRRHDR